MKKSLLSLPGLLFCFLVHSQQDSHYSQYMFNQMSFNPGYAGSKDEICTNLLNRQQWFGFPGAPVTTVFNVNAPVKPFNINSGVGLSVINDKIGFQNQTGINGTYCYKLDVGSGKLGIGVSLGAQQQSLDGGKWLTVDQNGNLAQGNGGNNNIPLGKSNALFFDMNLGVFYSRDDIYLGLSTTHVNQPKLKYTGGQNQVISYIERNYYVTGGYNVRLTNPLFEVAPSFYINSDLKATELTLNTNIVYNKRVWGGVSYRFGNAIIGIFGIELMNGIQIGYSYDFPAAGFQGSHEFWVGYNFKINRDKTPQKYKSVRFL